MSINYPNKWTMHVGQLVLFYLQCSSWRAGFAGSRKLNLNWRMSIVLSGPERRMKIVHGAS